MDQMAVSGVVVAGGKSQRLGIDKRTLRLWGDDGPTLLEHTLHVLAPLCADLVVVLNDPDNWRQLPARIVPDVYADAGALGGIYAGVQAATQPFAVVVAADMPLLRADLIEWMLRQPRAYDALVPRAAHEGKARNALNVEPMHAVYSRVCLEPLRQTLDVGQRRVIEFLERINTQVIEPDELRRHDPHGHAFLNINTPDDLARVQQLIAPSAG